MYQANEIDFDSITLIRVEFLDNTGYNVISEHWNGLVNELNNYITTKEDKFITLKLLNGETAMVKLSTIQSINTSKPEGREFNFRLNKYWNKKGDPDEDFDWK